MPRLPRLAALTLAAGTLILSAASPAARATTLPIDGQAQQQSNWCWAATGNSIADYYGVGVSQNTFCDLAFGYSTTSTCPNSQATLGNDQRAFSALGINPGTATGVISPTVVNREIQAGRPINTRIQWKSGGGHMMAIYGYDDASGSLDFYDPWPDDSRYNTATYAWYQNNASFSWTNSLYGIGA